MTVQSDGALATRNEPAYIGVDVGGTHTDVCTAIGGRVERGKALTTYDDFSRGVLGAIEVSAERYGLTLADLLERTKLVVNGTTVVTNAIVELRGCKVGALVTDGFTDTFRLAGGPRQPIYDDHLQFNAPDIIAAGGLAAVTERIGWAGEVIVPLVRDDIRSAIADLVENQKVEAIAVCLLNSFRNPAHELALRDLISQMYPDIFVSMSHQVFPVLGENRRWTTAVLNCFVQKNAAVYLNSLDKNLRSAGLKGGMAFFQGLGGGISLERAREFPLALQGSGPAGGAIGANALAQRMGIKKVLLGDMGGTSFDTGIIVDNEVVVDKNVQIGLLRTGVNVVDVTSVGAGGGSIVHLGDRAVPQVGPQSASSEPGPASYGLGGIQPTITDAMVVMGFMDPAGYLGGRFKLHPELAEEAFDEVAGAFAWTRQEAAAAAHDLVVANMANAVREVSVNKGHDPRDFVFFAYGGTLPMFAVQIAERLNIAEVIIPHNSSAFSAAGLLSSDYMLRFDRTVAWDLSRVDGVDEVNAIGDELVARAVADMVSEGFEESEIEITRSADFRFLGQAYELTIPLPNRQLEPDEGPALAKQFYELYERTYGEGTAWKGVPEQMQNYSVTARGPHRRPSSGEAALEPRDPEQIQSGFRQIFVPSLRALQEVPIYSDALFTAGSEVTGPAIIDATDTTIYLPPQSRARRDKFLNYVISPEGAQA